MPAVGDNGNDLDALDRLLLAVQDDETVRFAIRITALKALQHANDMLDRGSVANRVTVIRSMMPALVKTLERKETTDELNQLKEELRTLMEEVRGETAASVIMGDATTDTPHG